jgi:hypothetical protein
LFDRCGPKPYTLAPGAGCDVDILFSPTGWGPNPGALEVSGNVPGGSAFVPLQGNGWAPATLSASPSPLDFGDVAKGDMGKLWGADPQRRHGSLRAARVFPFRRRCVAVHDRERAMHQRAAADDDRAGTGVRRAGVVHARGAGQSFDDLRADLSVGLPSFAVPVSGRSP